MKLSFPGALAKNTVFASLIASAVLASGCSSSGAGGPRLPGAGLPSSGLPSSGLPSSGLPSSGLPGAGASGAGQSGPGSPRSGASPPSSPQTGASSSPGTTAPPSTDKTSAAGATNSPTTGSSGRAPAKTAEERQADLASDLDRSLEKFDELMLKEQEVVARNRPSSAGGASGSMPGDAADRSGTGATSPGRGDETDGAAGAGAVGGGGTAPSEANSGDDRVPQDIGDGNDDDIVARQLREAARAEDDPQLRQRLWDEYRAYKSGRRAPRPQSPDEQASNAEAGEGKQPEERP